MGGSPGRLTARSLACIQGLVICPPLADETPEIFPDVGTILLILRAER